MVLCPGCGATVAVHHLQPDAGVGQCPECREIFALGDAALVAEAALTGPDLVRPPAGVLVHEDGGRLTIRVPWVRSRGVGVFIGAGFLAMTFQLGGAAVFLAALGLLFGYFGLASLLNHTVIEADAHQVVVTHGPVAWPGSRVPRGPLAQLEVTSERVRWSRYNQRSYGLAWPGAVVLAQYLEPAVPQYVRQELARFYVEHGHTT